MASCPRWAAGAGVVGTAGRQAWAIAAVVAAGVLTLALLNGAGTSARDDGTARPAVAASSCSEPLGPGGLPGSLSIVGGPLNASSAVGVELNYTYSVVYRTIFLETGKTLAAGCLTEHGTTTTGANGSFSVAPSPLPGTCTETAAGPKCTEYAGPSGPIGLTPVEGLPVGYGLSVHRSLNRLDVGFVYELAGVAIDPAGPTVTTSVAAPTEFTAVALAANDSASPVEATFSWSLNGTGWEFEGASDEATVVALAVAGAGVATVGVRATAVVDGVPLPTVTGSVQALAVATAIDSGEANRTALDAGGSVAMQLTAEGAAGFAYRAYFQPGLGLAAVPATCTSGAPVGGEAPLACSAVVRYPEAGLAVPTANVTNGYSIAVWEFPEVTVSPPPELGVSPEAPVGYAGSPVDLNLVVANGTGTRPFAGACLASGAGPTTCLSAPGPRWSFAPTFSNPGNYTASAWARDASGANASVGFEITVVAPLALGGFELPLGNASVGSPFVLGAPVAGGALPLRYWWNASGLSGPVASGELRTDGNLTATLVPSTAGPMEVTLSVADRLGSVVEGSLLLVVALAPAARVATLVGAPAGPVTAGEPVRFAWAAYDRTGAPDRSFSANLDLSLATGEEAPLAWVNASGVGPLEGLSPGVYGIPSSAWIGGVLDLNVTVGSAGSFDVQLTGAGLPSAVASMTLTVAPDRSHVRLFDPQVRQGGGRTNATLWRVADRFGNPVPGALLTVELSLVNDLSDQVVAAIALPGGGSGVWINYSAPGSGAGELTVVDAAGQSVLGPLPLPVPGATVPNGATIEAVATAVPLGAIGLAALAVARRRRRSPGTDSEEELRLLAEGRARTVALVESAGAIDLAGLEAAWDPPPAPPALAEWVASLVADGTLHARVGEDGRARFCLASGRPEGPRLTLDPEALARSLRQRDDELRDAAVDGERP